MLTPVSPRLVKIYFAVLDKNAGFDWGEFKTEALFIVSDCERFIMVSCLAVRQWIIKWKVCVENHIPGMFNKSGMAPTV